MQRRNLGRWMAGLVAGVLVATVGGAAEPDKVRDSRFFKVNLTKKVVEGPAAQVQGALKLDLVSVSMDQPQYWPNEKVSLKLMFPGRPGAVVKGTFQKRDATGKDIKVTLDAHGVAVVDLMDGTRERTQLGEYRVDVATEDGKAKGSTTFTVVDGTLGAVSFAHEFKQITNPTELEKEDGAWFLGNASGAGKRWGNGLSFKNQLRVNNTPFQGQAQVNSRCMLPGCNGSHAGPTQMMDVRGGLMAGTLNVGGHSGPFQIEVVTPKGSIRYQFEGSSHVERDMMTVSGGMSLNHRAGLAPYEKTTQVPGRQIFVESSAGGQDAFELPSVIARDGKASFTVRKIVKNAVIKMYQVKADGTFEGKDVPVKGDLTTGQTVSVPVGPPYAFLTVGGFADGKFVEGWAVLFSPAGMSVVLDMPANGGPKANVAVKISTRDLGGAGISTGGILEVYDNRVASRSPFSPLGSSIGDSVRNVSNAVGYWQDRTGIEERPPQPEESAMDEDREMSKSEKKGMKDMSPRPAPAPPAMSSPKRAMMPMASARMGASGGAMAPGNAPSTARAPEEEEGSKEVIREGDKKVVFCRAVTTDASGNAVVDVTLPPQMGRVTVRFVAVKGLDHAAVQKDLDVTRAASVEARVPRVVMPGAQLMIPVTVDNSSQETVTLSVSGAGLSKAFSAQVKTGHTELEMPFVAGNPGTLSFQLRNGKGKLLDQRDLPIHSVGAEPVTYSRLVFMGKDPVGVGSDETAMVYASPGTLMRGTVMNMVTTMESWFGHSEAVSAQAAVRAVLLASFSRGILDDEGLQATVKVGLDKSVRDLGEAFLDGQENLIRPYPGLPGNPLWTAWVSRNLHSVVNTLQGSDIRDEMVSQSLNNARALAEKLDASLKKRGLSTEELGGYNAQGDNVIPVEIDGKVVYRVVTDDAVTRWATEKLLPKVDFREKDSELAFSKAYDTFRFLKAFERVGALQYLTELAKGYYAHGDMQRFGDLYGKIARGMILAQEPGMVQGPAMLGGVYSTPMAMVRFLELLLMMTPKNPVTSGAVTVNGKPGAFETAIKGAATVVAPAGAVVRVDRAGVVNLTQSGRGETVAKASVSGAGSSVGGELGLTLELDSSRDPLEYYAIIAVPSTLSIKQTEDILSDYRGVLIYGQQGQGSQQMQLMAVPFRGSRTMKLLLEGAYKGSSPGVVAIRHVEDSSEVFSVPIPAVTVR